MTKFNSILKETKITNNILRKILQLGVQTAEYISI